MAMASANANAVSRTLSTISSFSLDKSSHSHPSSSSSSSLAFPHQQVPVGLKTFEGFHCRPSVGCTKILQKSEKLQVEGDRTCRVSVRSAASTAPPLTVPKQKIRIKLRSYWVSLIEQSCKQIMDAARTTNAKTMGPVPLPTKRRVYCVLKSPHVHKDAREHLEMRTHQRLIDIENPNADTIDALMQLDIPAGVDVEKGDWRSSYINFRNGSLFFNKINKIYFSKKLSEKEAGHCANSYLDLGNRNRVYSRHSCQPC